MKLKPHDNNLPIELLIAPRWPACTMQAWWSRASQAQYSCRCRICLHSANTIIRRSTTSASRRKVTAADIFTACYTTILGAATVIDANRKDARRKELDQKLEKARAELKSPAIPEASDVECETKSVVSPKIWEIATQRRETEERTEESSTADLLQELGQMAGSVHRSRPRSSWLEYQIDWVSIEAAIAASEKGNNVFLRHPKNHDQLEKTVRNTGALVERLLELGRDHDSENTRCLQSVEDLQQGEEILDEVEELQIHYPSYEHPHVNPDAATEARNMLSESFRRIFNRTRNVKEMVGKICYNILLSSTPPNIHNYNTLIAGFNRVQRPELAEAVIESYLDHVKWPATQHTIQCLLNHARATNNVNMFREIVDRMKGRTYDGLHFRIIFKDDLQDESLRRFAEKHCAIHDNRYVWRAKRGHEVFDSLVRGWLHFGHLGVACMSFIACVRKGRVISAETIDQLLTECLGTLDQKAARKLLRGLAKNLEQFKLLFEYTIAMSSERLARKIVDMVYALFDLSESPNKPLVGTANRSMQKLLEIFRSMQTVHQCEVGVKKITATLHDIMDGLASRQPSGPRLDQMLSDLDRGMANMQTDALFDSKSRRLASLAALVKRYQTLERKTKFIDLHVKLSVLDYKLGLNSLVFWDRYVNWQKFQTKPLPESPIYIAMRRWQPKPGPLTVEDVKSQILDNIPDTNLARQLRDLNLCHRMSLEAVITLSKPYKPFPVEQTSIAPLERQFYELENATRFILFSYFDDRTQRQICPKRRYFQDQPLIELFGLWERQLRVAGYIQEDARRQLKRARKSQEKVRRQLEHARYSQRKAIKTRETEDVGRSRGVAKPAKLLLDAPEQYLGPADNTPFRLAAIT